MTMSKEKFKEYARSYMDAVRDEQPSVELNGVRFTIWHATLLLINALRDTPELAIIVLDPSIQYSQSTNLSLVQACGFLLPWIIEGIAEDEEGTLLRDSLSKRYAFFTGWDTLNKDSKLEANGIYFYPSDPPLYPYVKISQAEEVMFIYPYGLVIDTYENNIVITRMD